MSCRMYLCCVNCTEQSEICSESYNHEEIAEFALVLIKNIKAWVEIKSCDSVNSLSSWGSIYLNNISDFVIQHEGHDIKLLTEYGAMIDLKDAKDFWNVKESAKIFWDLFKERDK